MGLSPVWATTAGLMVVAALLVLVEPRAPVQRAAIMAGAFLSARLISGRTFPSDSLAGAVVILVALAPLDVRELGLQLSTMPLWGCWSECAPASVEGHSSASWLPPL